MSALNWWGRRGRKKGTSRKRIPSFHLQSVLLPLWAWSYSRPVLDIIGIPGALLLLLQEYTFRQADRTSVILYLFASSLLLVVQWHILVRGGEDYCSAGEIHKPPKSILTTTPQALSWRWKSQNWWRPVQFNLKIQPSEVVLWRGSDDHEDRLSERTRA